MTVSVYCGVYLLL